MRVLKAISGVLLVFLIISIIPSLVFAAENNTSSDHGGFFAGDFATIKSKVLNHLNNEISRLQGVSANVSAANNMTELQAALGRDRMSDIMEIDVKTSWRQNVKTSCNEH